MKLNLENFIQRQESLDSYMGDEGMAQLAAGNLVTTHSGAAHFMSSCVLHLVGDKQRVVVLLEGFQQELDRPWWHFRRRRSRLSKLLDSFQLNQPWSSEAVDELKRQLKQAAAA